VVGQEYSVLPFGVAIQNQVHLVAELVGQWANGRIDESFGKVKLKGRIHLVTT